MTINPRSLVPGQQDQGVFSISCQGASLSPDLQSSLVGDFVGKARIFKNKDSNGRKRPKLMASINAGSSVNCVHFHDFQNNFALIGCVSGVLMGFHYENFA
jgi:hypothetical protein